MTTFREALTREDIQALRRSFPVDAHSVREGPANNDKSKCMWFIYLDRFAIAERLDELFPGEWSFEMTEPAKRETHFSSVGTLTIKGVIRQFNGTQSIGTETWDKAWDDEKGCGTDTFRRVASMWGIGAYLNNLPINAWTAKPGKNDWDAQKAAKNEVLGRLGNWLNGNQGNSRPANSQQQSEGTTEVVWTGKRIDGLLAYWRDEGLTDAETLTFAEITGDKYDVKQWAKYPTLKDASGAIQAAFNTELSEPSNNGDRPAVWSIKCTHMAYVVNGNKKYLGFASCDPALRLEGATIIRAYGRTTKVKNWLGDYAYKELNLDQYTGADKTSEFVEMVIPIEFEYIKETTKQGETYLKATGIVGGDDAPVERHKEFVPPPSNPDDIPF